MTYRTTVGLTYTTDATLDRALREMGDLVQAIWQLPGGAQQVALQAEAMRKTWLNVAVTSGRMKLAPSGSIVDDVPEASLPWLLARGYLEAVDSTEGR